VSFWPSAYKAFPSTLSNEGYTDYPYLDDKGYVTVGQGNKIDNSDVAGINPAAPALALTWYDKNTNQTLSDDEVLAQWNAIKALQSMKDAGGGAFEPYSTMRLSQTSIQSLVQGMMDSMIATLGKRLPAIGGWPADAQLAILRWAWAFGPNANFPLMFAELKKVMPNFDGAVQQAELDQLNLPVKIDITHMFQNATDALDRDLDPSVLYWPGFPPGGGIGNLGFSVAGAVIGAGIGYVAYQGFKTILEGVAAQPSTMKAKA